MADIRTVISRALGAPNGHYAHAVVHGDVAYVSGQLGRWPTMSDTEAGDISAQAHRALSALVTVLQEAGSDVSRLLKMNIYIVDMAHWPAVDAEYRRQLGTHRPARAIVAAGGLHFDALIEVDAIAAIR